MLKKLIEKFHKWLNAEPTYTITRSELEKAERIRRAVCYLEWQLSHATAGEEYTCTTAGDKCSFSPKLVADAKEFVKQQEQSNPDWATWVEEWKAGKRY